MSKSESVKGSLLVVDDEQSMRRLLSMMLTDEGYEVTVHGTGEDALTQLRAGLRPDVAIIDLKMPGMGGIELLKIMKREFPGVLVIVITAFASLGFSDTGDTAVQAMRLGAFDYIKKPFNNDFIRAMVSRAVEQKKLFGELPDELLKTGITVGNAPRMREIYEMIKLVAPTDSTVLIQGESGTGKELVARAIHYQSLRASGPFIAINCGAFTETLLESELFGHKRGAFTGAVADKKGLVEIAEQGTFFLDEVSEMSQPMQVKLLRLLENREFKAVGGLEIKRSGARFITATNRNLEETAKAGAFREDLYYRLSVICVNLPPLRERREDIPLLAGHFLSLSCQRLGREIEGITDAACKALSEYDWPGNVRELENALQRAVTLTRTKVVDTADLPLKIQTSVKTRIVSETPAVKIDLPAGGIDLDKHLMEIEKGYMQEALRQTDGNLTRAAELLQMSLRSLRYKIQKLGIVKSDGAPPEDNL